MDPAVIDEIKACTTKKQLDDIEKRENDKATAEIAQKTGYPNRNALIIYEVEFKRKNALSKNVDTRFKKIWDMWHAKAHKIKQKYDYMQLIDNQKISLGLIKHVPYDPKDYDPMQGKGKNKTKKRKNRKNKRKTRK